MIRYLTIGCLVILIVQVQAQPSESQKRSHRLLKTPDDADSTYIMKYTREDDLRVIYGGQGSNISYGSTNEGDVLFGEALYNNVNDLAGFGLTYKFIDFDLAFSLPNVQIMDEESQNLSQFRLAYSYTMRKLAIRGYISDSKGVIVQQSRDGTESDPDVHLLKVGAQVTYYLNNRKHSYRSANFQNELQRKTAGSLLVRAEPFYRSLGMEDALIPDDRGLYGEQAGLEYVKTAGLMLMPGYGYNLVIRGGQFFVSPIIFFGPGVTVNSTKVVMTSTPS
ncbi:MAG TPA: DUF4421 family protein [Chryseolinea sp.]|nr:DUF4421 family protein [Chryseolinea sp.]